MGRELKKVGKHWAKWCWCFALQICLQSSLYSKLNFSSCTYSRDFYTWTFLSLYVWFVFMYWCCCSFVFQTQRQHVRLSGSLLVVDEVRTREFQNIRPQELPDSPFHQYDGCNGWLILILPLQTFVEFARCERVMTTRAKFHFSWVYTFAAPPRSLQIKITKVRKGSKHLLHWERPVATQHYLHSGVDQLAALSHIGRAGQ